VRQKINNLLYGCPLALGGQSYPLPLQMGSLSLSMLLAPTQAKPFLQRRCFRGRKPSIYFSNTFSQGIIHSPKGGGGGPERTRIFCCWKRVFSKRSMGSIDMARQDGNKCFHELRKSFYELC